MAPRPESTQSSRAPARPVQDQARSNSSAREENSSRSGTLGVATWKAAHEIGSVQAQVLLTRPDLGVTMIREKDRHLQDIANSFLNLEGDDSPRYIMVMLGPPIPGHKHKDNTPCCRLVIGCSPQGLKVLKPDPLLQQLRTIKTENNPSSPAPSTTNQVGVKSRVQQSKVFMVVSTRSQRLFSG